MKEARSVYLFPDVIQKDGRLFIVHDDWSVVCVSWNQMSQTINTDAPTPVGEPSGRLVPAH